MSLIANARSQREQALERKRLAQAREKLVELERLRQRQCMHMLMVLEEEQQAEERRQAVLDTAPTAEERARLESKFADERRKAADKIARLTEENEMVLKHKVETLGIFPKSPTKRAGATGK